MNGERRGLRDERHTLMVVREMLRSMPEGNIMTRRGDKPILAFNISITCAQYECGTVACIGGHAWLIENPGDFVGADIFVSSCCAAGHPLYSLFFPNDYDITPEQAGAAIDNYLARGNPDWDAAIEACPATAPADQSATEVERDG